MANYLLTTPQRNQVFRKVEALGLDAAAFRWTEGRDSSRNLVPHIEHSSSKSVFTVVSVPTYAEPLLIVNAWPRSDAHGEAFNPSDWLAFLRLISSWLDVVKLEVETPDLWNIAKDERAWRAEDDLTANTPFTPVEREPIALHLATIADYTVQ